MYRDSVDKIVGAYFAAFTTQHFVYKGREYTPKPLAVSPTLANGYTCPPGCGACCPKFSLDYLPDEYHPYQLDLREIAFDNRCVTVYSDLQLDNDNHHCRNLGAEARCGIHRKHPFTCDFELVRLRIYSAAISPNRIGVQLYGRKHAMKRQDGTRGAACTITPADAETQRESRRKLLRLGNWMRHFGLRDSRIQAVIALLDRGPILYPIQVD